MEFWAAFILGIAGSFHCAGMCGPLAMALPGKKSAGLKLFSGRFLYNIGRIITYSGLGLLFGSIGIGFAFVGYQQWLSIGLGAIMLIMALFSLKPESSIGFLYSLNGFLKKHLSLFIKNDKSYSLLIIGLLNGLLPCGFVYVALAGALALANPSESALYMAAFGAGTLPIMLAISIFGVYISLNIRNLIKKATPYILVVFASLLILRGLNLGIPYVSPKLGEEKHSCH